MTSVIPAQCYACTRLHKKFATEMMPGDRRLLIDTCDAFPAGIPDPIKLGADHRAPFGGDHGLQFLNGGTPEAERAFARWESYTASLAR